VPVLKADKQKFRASIRSWEPRTRNQDGENDENSFRTRRGGRVVEMATVTSWDRFHAQAKWKMSDNGACEAGIGGLKTHTHHLAAHHGRPGRWTSEDVEAARRLADEEQYPRRLHGRPPKKSGKNVHRRRMKNDVAAATSSNSVDKRSATNEASPYSNSWTGPAKLRSTVGPSSERSSLSAIFHS